MQNFAARASFPPGASASSAFFPIIRFQRSLAFLRIVCMGARVLYRFISMGEKEGEGESYGSRSIFRGVGTLWRRRGEPART